MRQRGYTHGIGQNGANAMTKLLTFHSSMLSFERSDMSDRLISDQTHILRTCSISRRSPPPKKVARYLPVITVYNLNIIFDF